MTDENDAQNARSRPAAAGAVPITDLPLRLRQAMDDGAGATHEPAANASGVFVMRAEGIGEAPRIAVHQLNARNAAALVLADRFALRSRDTVHVTAAPVARWKRLILQLLPTVQTVCYGALAEDRLRDPD